VQKKRSNVAVWTKNEVYLGYRFLKFVKVITTNELKSYLHLAPSSTLIIHNVEYTGHPLEIAFLLEYCTTCTNLKQIFVVIYNEDTTYLICKDFTLNISVNSFLTPHFIYSAVPELILWDKHRIYYSYNNLTDTGVLQTPTEFGNLSKLSHNSTIHDVFIDYIGNIVVKMENNIMFYFKVDMRDAVKLHLWTSSTTKSLVSMDMSGQAYLIYVFQNGSIQPQEYPLKLEVESVTFKTKEVCPYVAFECNISHTFYFLDKGDKLTIWAELVYPENTGLYIIVESYGPNILEKTEKIHYDIGFGHCTKTMTVTFSHNLKYEAVDNYFKLQSDLVKMEKHVQEAIRFKNEGCLQHDLFYIIEKSYLRHQPRKNLRVKYDWNKYGCPLKLDFRKTFHPLLQLYNKNGYVEDINVNFIVWEIHGRNDYSFSNTMEKSGCLHEAQTWETMTELNKDLPLEDAWGPQNYKHCFSYSIGKPGDLNQPYEIINKSNYNHLVWPVDHAGMYVFSVKILDPNYSFCNLTATFAIETSGLIPSPSGYLVGALLFLLMLIVFSILVLSYFHYMKIYRKYLYQPIKEYQGKQKAS
ncbi:Cation channel sperm-associated protein subunit epsilon, partial [Galemys pyrenaicus]